MRHPRLLVLLTAAAVLAAIGTARADCEDDLVQLEQAFKTPNLSAAGKAALEDAKTKAVSAMKKDDDATCRRVIADAMAKAGLTFK